MSTLSNTVSADGIRDVMEDLNSNGGGDAVAINNSYISDRFTKINGSANTSNTTSDTATKQYADAKSTFAINAGTANWTTGSGKSQINWSAVGWGTSGGTTSATGGGSGSQIGTLYDGSSSYTSSVLPFNNLSSSFESSKDLCYVGYQGSLTGAGGFTTVLVFEGSNAGTSDSDWTNVYFKVDGVGSSGGTDYAPGFAGITYARSAATVTTVSGRIVYKWALALVDFSRITYNGALLSGVDFNSFVSFD